MQNHLLQFHPKQFPVSIETIPALCNSFVWNICAPKWCPVTLKCATLRFTNNADMIETLLRSIISNGTWRSILTPTHSAMTSVIVWTFYASILIPLFHDILHVRDSIIGISILSLISLPTWTIFSFPWYNILVIKSLACKLINVISPRGPRVYLSVIGMYKFHSRSMGLNITLY